MYIVLVKDKRVIFIISVNLRFLRTDQRGEEIADGETSPLLQNPN